MTLPIRYPLGAALFVLLCAASPVIAAGPSAVEDLASRASAAGCAEERFLEACAVPGFFGRWLALLVSRAPIERRCAVEAARCLERLGPAARPAVPALVRVLREGPNDYDTGDGTIGARSAVAAALGAIGDPSAIEPLAEALRRGDPIETGPGASRSRRPAARAALIEALGRFGPGARAQGELIAGVLRERNADGAFLDAARSSFEYWEANRLVAEAIRQREPGRSSFTVPIEEAERERRRLDRTSREYLRAFEPASRDHEASAAARALGRLGDARHAGLLVETLRNPAAAEAAAGALAELRAGGPAAVAALSELLASSEHGPGARRKAVEALGAVGCDGAIGALIGALDDPDLVEPAATALGACGPRARAAVPALRRVVAQPSLAVVEANARHYSLEATQRLGEKIAAVRAIGAIVPDAAAAILTPFAGDEDVRSAIRRELAARDR